MYSIYFSENVIVLPHPVPTPLLYVVGVDRDSGDNGRIAYSIVSGDVDNFEINNETGTCFAQLFGFIFTLPNLPNLGAINLTRNVDADQILVVRATDFGNPPLFREQKIEVRFFNSSGLCGSLNKVRN